MLHLSRLPKATLCGLAFAYNAVVAKHPHRVGHLGECWMKKITFHVNSNSGLSLDRLEKSGWDEKLMSARGEVKYSVVRTAVGDQCIDIVGTIAFRKQVEETTGTTKRHVNRIVGDLKSAPFVKWHCGQPVSCVNSVEAWAKDHKTIAGQNSTANLRKRKSSP
jgi:hypothetical protein